MYHCRISIIFQTVAVTDSHQSADTYAPLISVDSSGSIKDSFHFDRIEPSQVQCSIIIEEARH